MSAELRDRLQAALGGSYTLERELGGGGMSRVFVATETALGRKVVVKVLPPEMAAGVNVDRFRREIQLAASLQHPHIVPLHAAGASGDLLYFTMPLIDGESLRARVARDGELPVHAAVRILRDVADALAYAHSRGVVHRDIKPDNVLLSGQHAMVTDFGVAKALESSTGEASLTSLGVALGTPAYMAPEQAAAEPHIDHRADIYAFGCLAYEVLTGRPPFAGMTAQQVLAAHITQRPEPVTARRSACPPGLGALITRCLEKKPADRPQSAGELHEQLELIATPSGGSVPTTAIATVVSKRPSRPRLAVALGLAGLIVVSGAGYWRLGRRAPLDRHRILAPAFVNKTGDPTLDPLIANVSAAVSSGLVEIQGVEVVEGERNLASAGTLVSGALYRRGDSIQILATIADASSGKTVYTVGPLESPVNRPRDVIEPVAQRIVGGVATMLDPTLGAQGVLPARAPRWDAYREFQQGDVSFYIDVQDSAFVHFARAVSLDPTFAYARLRAAQVLVDAGTRRYAAADSALAAVGADRATFSPFERAYFGWIEASHRGNMEGAHTATVMLTEATPRSEMTAYIRGNFANLSMRWHEAVRILDGLDPLSSALRIRSAYYLHLANAHHMLDDHARELAVARRARDRFPDQMRVRRLEVRALAALGDSVELERRLSDVLSLQILAANQGTAGQVLLVAAREGRAHGHPTIAKNALAQLLDWIAGLPEVEDTTSANQRLRIDALRLSGQTERARAIAESLTTLKPNEPGFVGLWGVLEAQRGQRAEADRASAQLRALSRPALFGEPTLWRARIAAQLGDKSQAVALLRAAMTEGSRVLAANDADPDLEPLRDFPSYRELTRARD